MLSLLLLECQNISKLAIIGHQVILKLPRGMFWGQPPRRHVAQIATCKQRSNPKNGHVRSATLRAQEEKVEVLPEQRNLGCHKKSNNCDWVRRPTYLPNGSSSHRGARKEDQNRPRPHGVFTIQMEHPRASKNWHSDPHRCDLLCFLGWEHLPCWPVRIETMLKNQFQGSFTVLSVYYPVTS